MSTPQHLLEYLRSLHFEPLSISRVVDSKRRLAQDFDPSFPLIVRCYSFPSYREMLGANWLNWHEHLEMILPVTGSGRFRLGEQVMDFSPGDLLLVDNQKMHGMQDLSGDHQSLVIFFMPELIYRMGSFQCDAAFLSPFFERADSALPVLRGNDPAAESVHASIVELVKTYQSIGAAQDKQVACKLHLLQILHGLRKHFQVQGTVSPGYAQQRQRVQRLKRLFDFLNQHFAQKLKVAEAASMVGMSETRFKDFFKRTTGSTFAQYVIQLRLSRATQLLRDTELSVAEIALQTGFCDQSHFDNRFKDSFEVSPKEYRQKHQRRLQAA
ncbi:MAG: helix-turn-helix domain-containing protein [Verrucomicrobiota bacterium]